MNLARHLGLGCMVATILASACSSNDGPIATGPGEVTGTQRQALTQTTPFDWDNGNVATDVIIPVIVPTELQNVAGGDATLILRITTMVTNAWFDAIAPYEPTTVGVYSRIPRRPASESATNRNKNIAMAYAALRSLSLTIPHNIPTWRAMLTGLGLDPDDTSTDLTTPVGIGNFAANAVNVARTHDGFNQLGDEGGPGVGALKYNLEPMRDTTGYQPSNSPFELTHPSRWQPAIITRGFGSFQIQQYVTPQLADTTPYTIDDVDDFNVPPPVASDWEHHPAAYKAQADDVLAISAGLTDNQKMIAELFNNKFFSLGFVALFITQTRGLTVDQFVQYDFMVNLAAFDGGIVVWKEKTKYDAVRPFSAIDFLYHDKKLTAWGGPGKGTVTDIRGKEWKNYLPIPDHPEYPSGSACFCAAHAEASRRFLGSDALGWPPPAPKGSSVIEPGVTPATDITVGPFNTWTEFAQLCGMSRRYGGVHFAAAITASAKMCQPIGDTAYDFVQRHIQGRVH